jgi:cobalamin biosynthesis Mg chelatase CobN
LEAIQRGLWQHSGDHQELLTQALLQTEAQMEQT